MTRAELVERMARSLADECGKGKRRARSRHCSEGDCACITDATAALAAIEAAGVVLVPARSGITPQMEQAGGDVLTYDAINAILAEELHPDDMVRRIYRAMLAASPLAKAPLA